MTVTLRYSNAMILIGDNKDIVKDAHESDFIYLDPPYDPVGSTSDFTTYTPNGFGAKDQLQLADIFRNLADKECWLLLSNSDTPFIRGLYSDFNIKGVNAQRTINCKASKRMGHRELLISNYI